MEKININKEHSKPAERLNLSNDRENDTYVPLYSTETMISPSKTQTGFMKNDLKEEIKIKSNLKIGAKNIIDSKV